MVKGCMIYCRAGAVMKAVEVSRKIAERCKRDDAGRGDDKYRRSDKS